MRNTFAPKSIGKCKLRGLILTLMVMFSISGFPAMEVFKCSKWNGDAVIEVKGNYFVVSTDSHDGFTGTVLVSGVEIHTCNDNDIIEKHYNANEENTRDLGEFKEGLQLQTKQASQSFWVQYDPIEKSLNVSAGLPSGLVVLEEARSDNQVCFGGYAKVCALAVDLDVYELEWGVQRDGETETSWLPEFKNQTEINYGVTETSPFRIFSRLTKKDDDTFISTHDALFNPTYASCGNYHLTEDYSYVCAGQPQILRTDYQDAEEYVWKKGNGQVVAVTKEPFVEITPSTSATYSCYVNNIMVGAIEVYTQECSFFIGTKYPVGACLQDYNYLYAAGTLVLRDMRNDNAFKWEWSDDDGPEKNWTVIRGETSIRLKISATNPKKHYRLTYGNNRVVLDYPLPDCAEVSSSYCNGLESKTLFNETFGFFMSPDIYVSHDTIYPGFVNVNHETTLTIDGSPHYMGKEYEATRSYYKAKQGDQLSVDITKKHNLYIRNYISPDPFGHIVTATTFAQQNDPQDANQFVGENGHLFMCENPMLGQYERDEWVDNAAYRLQDGYYAIVTNPSSCDHNKDAVDFISCTDHTGNPNGAMLFVNAGKTDVSKAAIFAQEAELTCPADRFNFSMSVRNATAPDDTKQKNPVNLTICLLKSFDDNAKTLPDENDANVLARISTGDVEVGSEWLEISEYIQLPNRTDDVWVVIYNNGPSGDGNDMLLDDISFSVCIPRAELKAYKGDDEVEEPVVSCSGDEITLKGRQYSEYLSDPYFIFQYQDSEGEWKDMADYKTDESLMKKSEVVVDTKLEQFWGDVNYRVVISDDKTVARRVADGEEAQGKDDECEFTYHTARTDLVIRNTYGGPMGPRESVSFCNIVGTIVPITGVRNVNKEDHEWKMTWLTANRDIIVPTQDVVGHPKDILKLVVKEGDVFSITSSEGELMGDFPMEDLQTLYFVAEDEGGCQFEQEIVMHKKINLDLKPVAQSVIDCNSVTVQVGRTYSEEPDGIMEPKLTFDWSAVEGEVVVVDENTQTFSPKGLDLLSKVSSKVKITPVNVDDQYCFLQDFVEVPYTAHNGKYEVTITSTKDPVCVSSLEAMYDMNIVTLTANVSTKKGMTGKDAAEIDKKIKEYHWVIQFSDGEEIRRTTTENKLVFKDEELLNEEKDAIRADGMIAYIESTLTEVCDEVVQDTTGLGTNVEIREGGFVMQINTVPSVCLNGDDKKSHTLKIQIHPESALLNFDKIDLYIDEKKSAEIGDLQEEFNYEVKEEDFPNVFKPGNTSVFYVSVYDETCKSQSESNNLPVKYNGYDWTFNSPDTCMKNGDTFNMIATLDEPNAANHIKSYVWKLDDTQLPSKPTDKLTYSYNAKESMTGKFSLTTSDGICPDVTHEFTSNISVDYAVSLKSNTDKICSMGSAEIQTIITPSTSRKFIKKYTWMAIDKDGKESKIKESEDVETLTLTAEDFPDLFVAGNTFKIYVITDDEICEPVKSDNQLPFDVNVPFTLSVKSNGEKLCYKDGMAVELNVTVEPANAINHIKEFKWTREGNGTILKATTEGTKLDVTQQNGWLTPADGVKFVVSASDGICVMSESPVTDETLQDINQPYEVTLTADRPKVCSVGQIVTLTGTNSRSNERDKAYTYQYVRSLNGEEQTDMPSNPDNVLKAVDDVEKNYTDLKPKDVIYYMLTVNDGDVCGPVTAGDGAAVVVQTPFKVHIETSKDLVCKGERIVNTLVSVTPEDAGEFIRYFGWNQVGKGSLDFYNAPLPLTMQTSGEFTYYVDVVDKICYGNEEVGPLQSDSVTIKVNEPIQVNVDISDATFCDDPATPSMVITATSLKGEPKRYELYGADGTTLLNAVDTEEMTYSWTDIRPTQQQNKYTVHVLDNVCEFSTDPAGAKIVDVHLPVLFDVVLPADESEICLGETLHFTTTLTQGAPKSYEWTKGLDKGLLSTQALFVEDKPTTSGEKNFEITAVDGVCPDVTKKVGPVKVYDPIEVSLDLSADKYCDDPASDPMVVTAKVVKGEPKRFELFVENGPMIGEHVSTDLTQSWEVHPTQANNRYIVYVYDNVCPVATDPTGAKVVDVHLPLLFEVSIPDEDYNICLGDTVHFTTALTQGTPALITWTGLNSKVDAFSMETLPKKDIPAESGDIYYEITMSDVVCPSVTQQMEVVKVYEPIEIELTSSKDEVVIGSMLDLTAQVIKGEPTLYQWTGNKEDLGTTEENYLNEVVPKSSTKYMVYATDGICPIVEASYEVKVQIPTAFTPYDREGYNDFFMKGFDVMIFDRYGMKVFEGSDGWDGRKGNDLADAGVYFCKVVLKDGKVYKGTIEIVRIE